MLWCLHDCFTGWNIFRVISVNCTSLTCTYAYIFPGEYLRDELSHENEMSYPISILCILGCVEALTMHGFINAPANLPSIAIFLNSAQFLTSLKSNWVTTNSGNSSKLLVKCILKTVKLSKLCLHDTQQSGIIIIVVTPRVLLTFRMRNTAPLHLNTIVSMIKIWKIIYSLNYVTCWNYIY